MSEKELEIEGPGLVRAHFTRAFTAVVYLGDTPVRIAGPGNAAERRLRCVLGNGETLRIESAGFFTHTVDVVARKEHNSGIPVELAVPEDRPLSLREEMKRYIREMVSQTADQRGEETFEEADDFEVFDADELDLEHSPYEIMEMAPEDLPSADEDPKDSPESESESQAEKPPSQAEPAPSEAP